MMWESAVYQSLMHSAKWTENEVHKFRLRCGRHRSRRRRFERQSLAWISESGNSK